jgi:hypothetical protein
MTRERLARLALLATPALISALLVLWATATLGPGTEGDTSDYICAAQTFVERGALYDCGGTWPLIHFPPLYPGMLAVGIRSGLAPLSVARYIAAGSCAVSLLMAGAILEAMTSSLLLALVGEILLMWAAGVSTVFLYALTEAPFDGFLLLFVWCLWRAIEDDGVKWIVAAGAAAAAAALTRYVGVALLITGSSALLCLSARRLNERIHRAAWFIAVGLTPVAGWFIRNHFQTHSIGRPVVWHPPGGSYFFATGGMVARWFFPTLSSERGYWFGGIVLVIIVALLIAIELRSTNRLEWLMANVILAYGAILMLSRVLMDVTVFINQRMLAPIAVLALLLALRAIWFLVAGRGVGAHRLVVAFGLSLATLTLVVNSGSAPAVFYQSRVGGLGFTRRTFSDSEMIRWTRQLAADTPIYSDSPEPIILFAGHLADTLPVLRDPRTGAPSSRYPGELAAMQKRLRDRPGAIAYFYDANTHELDNIPRPAEMSAVYQLSMGQVLSTDQGIMFEARTLPTVRASEP